MPEDATTFTAAFLALWLGIILWLWRLERIATRLQRRQDLHDASTTAKKGPGTGRT